MSTALVDWTRPKAVDPVTVRCPSCGTVFTRVLGTLHPRKGDPYVEIEAVCKDRRCRKAFTVKVGILPAA